MTISLTLAQHHLYTFQACPRRFYLRFLARVPWPEAPLGSELETAYDRGRRFHRRIERYFLGLPVSDESNADPVLNAWWDTFLNHAPRPPGDRRFVETALTIPIGPEGRHHLTGRFDLLVIDDGDRPAAALVDWKTGEPRTIERLRRAWQTRVYLILLAEGGPALTPEAPAAFAPDRLSLTYWYLEDPTRPRVVNYDPVTHRRNLAEVEQTVAQIDACLASGEWPLTEEWAECRRCAYQAYCGRQAAGFAGLEDVDEDEEMPDDAWLEPQWG